MKRMNWVNQFLTKRKFIFFLTASFLLVPTVACAQVIEMPSEQVETVPLWPEKNEATQATPTIEVTPPINQNQEAPYGTILMTQKTVSCNNTPVIRNYIQKMGGMAPITFGTNLNQMGAITSLIQVYANPMNKRFAVVEHFATQKSCILTHGNGFEIILPPQPEEVPN